MTPNRRVFASTLMLTASAAALTACGAIGGQGNVTVEQIIARAQSVLSYTAPIVPLLAVFVPGAEKYVAVVEAGLDTASGLLNTLTSTMKDADAKPVIGQISAAIGGALAAAEQVAAMIKDPTQRTRILGIIASARAVTNILVQYATSITGAVTAPVATSAAARVRTRAVR